jgi:uncharacterized membrane protein YfcA
MLILAILAGAATGIVLGLFGSGGSIIAMPALMYLLGIEAKSAIAMSLGIVAVTATLSGWDHWRRGNVDMRVALVFAFFGMVGTFSGAKVGVMTPVAIQLTLFALVMYAAAWKMLKPALLPQMAMAENGGLPTERQVEAHLGHVAVHGIGVGVLTGMVGVGGGFLIVPALALLSGLPMKLAVGTSLVIVAAKSYAGFVGYFGAVPLDWNIMGLFTAVTIVGSFLGTRLAHRFSQEMLKKSFGVFLMMVATYILVRSAL